MDVLCYNNKKEVTCYGRMVSYLHIGSILHDNKKIV